MRTRTRARLFKIGGASLAYLPMFVLLFAAALDVPFDHPLVTGCLVFNFPAISLVSLIQTFHVSQPVLVLSTVMLILFWSSFMAWFFWRAVGTLQGDDEADDQRGQYDWVGFQVRFVIGFVVGFLLGWRFVRYSNSMKILLIASFVTGIIGGLAYGLSHPPNFWSRS